MGKKKKANPPRRKRYNRDQRLQNAKTKWLLTTTAKNITKSYSKWYGVNLLCAIKELEILGFSFSDYYKEEVETSLINRQNEKRKRKEQKEVKDDYPFDSDEQFSFIAGYTGNGVPFGVQWDEE
jgi:hypothetical protein